MIQRGPAAQEGPNAEWAEAARGPRQDLRVLPPQPTQAPKPERVPVLAKELAQVQKASVLVWEPVQLAPFAADSRAWGRSAAP
jgi:hypothetical protein